MGKPINRRAGGLSYMALLTATALIAGFSLAILTVTPKKMDFGYQGLDKRSLTASALDSTSAPSLIPPRVENIPSDPAPVQPAVYNVIGVSEDYVNNLVQGVRDELDSLKESADNTNIIYYGGNSSAPIPPAMDLSSIDGSTITNSTFSGSIGVFSDALSTYSLAVSGDSDLIGNLKLAGSLTLPGLALNSVANALCVDNNGIVTSAGATECSGATNQRTMGEVVPIDSGLSYVLAMHPVSFRYNQGFGDDGRSVQFGLIAEDVHELDPRLTTVGSDGQPTGVRYDLIAPFLIKAMQESQIEIENLTLQVNAVLASSTDSIFVSVLENLKSNIATATDWVFAKIRAGLAIFDRVETRTAAVTAGLEMTDQSTGGIYCITIKNGDWNKQSGDCAILEATTTAPVIQIPDPATTTILSNIGTTTPTTTPEIIPIDSPPINSTSTPEVNNTGTSTTTP